MVGAPLKNSAAGAAYVFAHPGGAWSQQAKLSAPNAAAGDELGYAVALYAIKARPLHEAQLEVPLVPPPVAMPRPLLQLALYAIQLRSRAVKAPTIARERDDHDQEHKDGPESPVGTR